MAISGKTVIFGCIAHPASHVRAPTVFNALFQEQEKDGVMIPIDFPEEALAQGIAGLHAMPNFKGAAVTIPHKMTLAALCDELGPVAKITGAVNAVRFEDGKLYGDNFDGAGFVAGLISQGHDVAGKKCLLIGAGGAAHAIAYALATNSVAQLSVTNRTISKAQALQEAITSYVPDAPLTAEEAPDFSAYDIIINATALGLHEGDAMPCDVGLLQEKALVCDIIMFPEVTPWLKAAQDRGLACHYGRHMLDNQIGLIGDFIGVNQL